MAIIVRCLAGYFNLVALVFEVIDMTAPQVIAIILLTVRVIGGLCEHGKQVDVDFRASFVTSAIWAAILYFGGFFD